MHIPLRHGLVALVDDADAELVAGHHWHAVDTGHGWLVVANLPRERPGASQRHLKLHRHLLGFTAGDPQVDHINGDGLDNRRSNLRPATTAQNSQNRGRRSDNRTGFKGVGHSRNGRFTAAIRVNGIAQHLGTFDTAEQAADAYDAAALHHFGAFARTNRQETTPCGS